MEKCRGCLVVLMLVVLILTACSSVEVTDIPTATSKVKERDLSTPSSRLVGHWRANTPLQIEYYFAEINPETGEGIQIEYDPRGGSVFICKYKIYSETPDGKNLSILIIAPDGTEIPRADFVIDEDGMNAQMRAFTITYLDNKTEYQSEKK